MISQREKEKMVREDEKYFLKNQFLRIGLMLIIGLPLLYLLFASGRHVYRQAKFERSISQAREFKAEGDLQNAIMALQNAFLIDQDSVAATEMMGDLAEEQNSPSTLGLRFRLVKLDPESASAQIKLARATLRDGRLDEARAALDSVRSSERDTVEFWNLKSALALESGDLDAAEEAARSAIRLDQKNPRLELNLAIVLLRKGDPANSQELNASLQYLQQNPETRTGLREALLAYSMQRGQWKEAESIVRDLLDAEDAGTGERLTLLDILKRTDSAAFMEGVEEIAEVVPATPLEAVEISSWLTRNGLTGQAQEFLDGLPAQMRSARQLQIAEADIFAALGRWKELEEFLGVEPWADAEYIRQTYLAKAIKNLTPGNGWVPHWRMALREAAENPMSLLNLHEVVASWEGWEVQSEQTLWKIFESRVAPDWALDSLHSLYMETGDSAGLFKVISLLYKEKPDDPAIRNNFALLSLLRKTNVREAYLVAKQNHADHPENPFFTSTFAFAVYREEGCAEALAIMEKMPEDALMEPSVAAYMGIFLADCEKPAEAARYLELAGNGRLLDAEALLVKMARAKTR